MGMSSWLEIENGRAVLIDSVPVLSALGFEQEVCKMMDKGQRIIVNYFAVKQDVGFRYFIIIRDLCDFERGWITSFIEMAKVVSLTKRVASIGVFEREIAELHGVEFVGNSWLKPLRYPFNRADQTKKIGNYPFYAIESEFLHQVHVGPVHAGVIEPGVFRFYCEGERIQHLEISLGYQHRGVESMICGTDNRLRQVAIAETIAGDTTIGHTLAMCKIVENGWSNPIIESERAIALEMERIAMHIADTGALAMDTGYQLGQVSCEALRTIVINCMQSWCGNRFGRTLVRPFGTNFKLELETIELIKKNLEDVVKRYKVIMKNLLTSPDFLARVDEICFVDPKVAKELGAVGIAGEGGDMQNRIKLRLKQVVESSEAIFTEIKTLSGVWFEKLPEPIYDKTLEPNSLIYSLVKGWRGDIVHVALTDQNGMFSNYKIVDPSVRNWMMLALSVRSAEISDFPLSNKSYNLSYCGHDL